MSILNGVIAPEIKVEFDLSGGGPKEPSASNWTTVATSLVRSISIRRGKTQENQVVQAGECTIVFDNRTGDFDPMNSASPYWTNLIPAFGGYSRLSTHMGVRVWARWNSVDYVLYTGYLEQLSMDYGLNPTATITFTDAIAWLAQQYPVAQSTPIGNGDTVAYRFGRVLDAVSFPTILRGISPSVDSVMYGTKLDGDGVTLLQQAASCGPARFHVSAAGLVICKPIMSGATSGLILSDAQTAGRVGYDLIEVDPGSKYLVNTVGITKVDGNGDYRGFAYGFDGISQLKYGISQQDLTLPVSTASPVASFLAYQYSTPYDRVRRITFSNTKLGTNFPKTLGIELSDYVSIERTTYDGRSLSFTCQVEGIEHDITPTSWEMGFTTSTTNVQPTGGTYWFGALFDSATITADGAVQTDSAGNVYALGTSGSPLQNDQLTVKISAGGVIQWQRTVPGWLYGKSIMTPNGIAMFNGGGLLQLDPDGNVAWEKEIAGAGIWAISADSSGNIIAVGTDYQTPRGGFVVKFDSSGAVVWQIKLLTHIGSVAADPSGSIFVSGGGALFKLSSSGAIIWQRAVTGFSGGAVSLLSDASGNCVAYWGNALMKFSGSGTALWGYGVDLPSSMYLSLGDDGSYYLYSTYSGPIFAKFNSSGVLQFARSLGTGGASVAASAGKIFVGSSSYVGRVPNDGTKTGSYTITGPSSSITATYSVYSASSTPETLTVTTPTFTSTANSLTINSASFTASYGTAPYNVTYI